MYYDPQHSSANIFFEYCILSISIRGCSHITSAVSGGGWGWGWQMLTIADEGGGGQKIFQQKEFKGTKNVGTRNN